jgi:hypothetical protein
MRLSFFKAGPYPFESVGGMVSNLAIFNSLTEIEALELLGFDSAKVDSCFYVRPRSELGLPACKPSGLEDHFPSSYFPSNEHHRYCAECAPLGYHSAFTFVLQVDRCLLHGSPLKKMCDSCSRLHLNDTPHPSFGHRCSDCGYHIPRSLDQLPYRGDNALRAMMQEAGLAQKKWFGTIMAKQEEGYPFNKIVRLKCYEDDEDLTRAVIQLLNVENPFFSTHRGVTPSSIELHHWRADECSPYDVDELALRKFETRLNRICAAIEKTYLIGHESCLRRMEKSFDYQADDSYICPLCPLAVAYSYFRLRLRFRHGDNLSEEPVGALGFAHIKRLAMVHPWLVSVDDGFYEALFLKILGEIKLLIDSESSAEIRICAGGGILTNMIENFSTTRGMGVEFVRNFDPRESECGAGQIYQYVTESERFLVRKAKFSYHIILCNNVNLIHHAHILI